MIHRIDPDDDARAPPRRRPDPDRPPPWKPRRPDECGKQCYATKAAALVARSHQARRGRKLYPYRCRACAAWHLARRNDRTRRGVGWVHQED